MYNLAKREFLPKVGETPDNVGPSTYIFESYRTFKRNYAPFLSVTTRHSQPAKPQSADTFYNVSQSRHIPGGSSIQDKSKRVVYTIPEGPGPADYNVPVPKRQAVPDPIPPRSKGKLYLCNTPKSIYVLGPSVPTKIDENGYFVDEDLWMIKNPPDTHDISLGPAFYKIESKPFFTTNRYKGCEWSKRKAKRQTVDINTNPGPGEYDIPSTLGRFNEYDERVREMARLLSFVPRSLEATEMNTLKEDLPGPGHYNLSSTLKVKIPLSIHPQPFISGAKRWRKLHSDSPSPNKYRIKSNIMKGNVSYANVPFGNDAPRFTRKIVRSPGPADYNVEEGTIAEKMGKKRNYFGTVSVPFNITEERKMSFVADDSYFMPGPANYLLEAYEPKIESAANCNFRSVTQRFEVLQKTEDAEPATYNIVETFKKNRDHTSHNTGTVPFQTKQPKGLFQRISDNPSPADYLSHRVFGGKDFSFYKTPRWERPADNFPGPGSYNINPQFEDSTYKSYTTYNLRLRENVMRKRLRLPPGKTWESWYKELKKKKTLKCYVKESSEPDYLTMLFKDM